MSAPSCLSERVVELFSPFSGLKSPLVAVSMALSWCAIGCSASDVESSREAPAVDADTSSAISSDGYGVTCALTQEGDQLRLTLGNTGRTTVKFLAWNTLWDDKADVLSLKGVVSGREAAYRGPELRRVIDERSFRSIEPGTEISTTYDPSTWYRPEDGERVAATVRQSDIHLIIDGSEVTTALKCPSVELALEPRSGESSQALLEPYPSCTDAQKERINRTIDGAYAVARAAIRDFDNHNEHQQIRWFGDLSNNPRVAYERMLTEDELVRCGGASLCTSALGVVSEYFYDDKLYLCGSLFANPYIEMTSFSWVEVLVHELAHFVDQPAGDIVDWDNPNCTGYGDKCYEYPNALRLATCERCAQRNAENYAGFGIEAFMRPALLAAIQ